MKVLIIFGGAGFIGSHFADYSLKNKFADKVIVCDIKSRFDDERKLLWERWYELGVIDFREVDVRKPISLNYSLSADDEIVVANFAAVHREPGHENCEYFETNILGAENVCNFATSIGCADLIFTSSISPYGPSDDKKSESSIPNPETAYGASKIIAEYIHRCWKEADSDKRNLVIVRPGVVFGFGENGNVTRLLRAVLSRRFIFIGNKKVKKAGIYVKELCAMIWWARMNLDSKLEGSILFNATMPVAPTLEEYVASIQSVSGQRYWLPSVPKSFLFCLAVISQVILGIFGKSAILNVVRVKKLVRSNDIVPEILLKYGYNFTFNLSDAFLDWKREHSSDWK